MKVTKRHYYKFKNPITGKIKEVQYETAITVAAKKKLQDEGFQLIEEIYWDPFFWRMMKQIADSQ